MNVYIFVGNQADPSLIEALYKVQDFTQINIALTEEEIFENCESSAYLTNLYSLIN